MSISKVALVALASLSLCPVCAKADSPLAAQGSQLLPAPEGLRFELRLPEGKTRFQIGETIPVGLLFSNIGSQTLKLNVFYQAPPSLLAFAGFEVEPRQGVSNPLGDLPPETGMVVNGYVPPPVVLGEKPTEVPLLLNEFVRFDRPGTYSVRAVTSHIIVPAEKAPPRPSIFFGGNATATSTPVSVQIVPADPKWQAKQVQAWRALWAQQKPDASLLGWKTPPNVPVPTNDLRFLNTHAAAQAIIDRLGQDEFPRSSGSEAYFWRSGLIGFSDRPWLIEAMKSAMKRPDYPITQGFLDNLAKLQTLRSGAPQKPTAFSFGPSDAQILANWNLAFASLGSKTGRARAMTVHSLLESAWGSSLEKMPGVQQRLPGLVAMVPDIFLDLPPLPQLYLIDTSRYSKEWARIKSPRMVAPLRRLWDATPLKPNDSYHEFPNSILQRLYELDPKRGRALILQEMAKPNPRVSFQVLSLLPDERLPQLQKLWLAHLSENGADQDTAAILIGRYANDGIKAQVQKEFAERQRNHMFSVSTQRGLERYLARVK